MKKLSILALFIFLGSIATWASVTKVRTTGSLVNSDGSFVLPGVGLSSIANGSIFIPVQVDSSGNLITTTTDSAISLVSTQTKVPTTGSIIINTGDGIGIRGAPLAGITSGGAFIPVAVDGTGKLITSGGGGSVTSVGLSLPNIFTVTNSPVTTSGTLTGTLASQNQNLFFSSPNGSSGTPSFRSIVSADIPTLNQNTTGTSSNVTGTVAIANGGTGSTTAASATIALIPASVTPAALAIDWSAGTVFKKTISTSSTFTFSNTKDGETIVFALTTTGSYTATFPTAKWPGGSQPTQTASGTDIYTFIDIGGTIYASVVQGLS